MQIEQTTATATDRYRVHNFFICLLFLFFFLSFHVGFVFCTVSLFQCLCSISGEWRQLNWIKKRPTALLGAQSIFMRWLMYNYLLRCAEKEKEKGREIHTCGTSRPEPGASVLVVSVVAVECMCVCKCCPPLDSVAFSHRQWTSQPSINLLPIMITGANHWLLLLPPLL